MANELAARNDVNLDELQRTASMLVASGYFDAKGDRNTQIAQLATKIMAGRELGYGPFASVQGIHVIQGKLQVAANLMAAAVKSHPRYDYRVRRMDNDGVRIEFFENGESIGMSEFTREDATKAGTQNVNKFPRNMLFARALSNGVRWFCPDVFHGQSVYVEGELEDTGNDTPAVIVVDRETGEIVEGEYTTMQAPPVTPVTPTNGNGHTPTTEIKQDEFERYASIGQDPPMVSNVQLKKLNALGTQLYGAEWTDEKRHALVAWKTKNRTQSSKELTADEADSLISGLQKKINEAAAAVQSAPEAESIDNPFTETPEPVTA